MYFLLRTEEYLAFYRTFNRVYSIIIDLIIFNNYIDAQNIRVTDKVIFSQVTDPGLRMQRNAFMEKNHFVTAYRKTQINIFWNLTSNGRHTRPESVIFRTSIYRFLRRRSEY